MQPPPDEPHLTAQQHLLDAPSTLPAQRLPTQSLPTYSLAWQSRLVLLLTVPAAAVWAAVLLGRLSSQLAFVAVAPLMGVAAGAVLAVLAWRSHAATPAGACTGGLLMGCFCLTAPGWRSCGWAVLLMLSLTLAATRAGRARKQRLVSAVSQGELKHGRRAAQVAANLGISALAGALIDPYGQVVALTVLFAALAEAAADTLASEIGQAFAGTPRSILTLRPVPPGTDGGITLMGTLAGIAGATLVALVGGFTLQLPAGACALAVCAAVAGLFFDSLLGATLEQAGWLNNDAVNFLSTVFAALIALLAAVRR